jgi:hypothetical protein
LEPVPHICVPQRCDPVFLDAPGAVCGNRWRGRLCRIVCTEESASAAADAAAIGGANELYLAGAELRQVQEVANSIAQRVLAGSQAVKIETSVPPGQDEVTVQIKQDSASVLTAAFGVFDTVLQVHATARVVGGGRLCGGWS